QANLAGLRIDLSVDKIVVVNRLQDRAVALGVLGEDVDRLTAIARIPQPCVAAPESLGHPLAGIAVAGPFAGHGVDRRQIGAQRTETCERRMALRDCEL